MSFFLCVEITKLGILINVYLGDFSSKRLSGYSFYDDIDVIGHFDAERETGS